MGWLIVLVAALMSLTIPFALIEWIASYLPEPLRMPVTFVLNFLGFPALLCWLHSRKVFGQGRGSAFFRIYTIFYMAMGALFLVNGVTNQSGSLGFWNAIGGVFVMGIGVAMFLWARRTDKAFAQALAVQDEIRREDSINAQAEAILRAEEMKKERGL